MILSPLSWTLELRLFCAPKTALLMVVLLLASSIGNPSLGRGTPTTAVWSGYGVSQSCIAASTQPSNDESQATKLQPRVGLKLLDFIVLGTYLAMMVGIGFFFARRKSDADDFFLGGRKIPWWAAGLSIFATQLSAITFMAVPAIAFGTDWTKFVGYLLLVPVFLVVIYFFLPMFCRLSLTTAYEYLEKRFSLTIRWCASALFIFFQLGRMGIVLLLPALALSAVTGIDTYLCIALMGFLATTYTALGGISAVIWTDVAQVVVLLSGAIICFVVATVDAGGLGAVVEVANEANKFHMLDWRWSYSDMVAWVVIVGFFFSNLVPYATDQTIVQRYLTTSNEKEAARSMWLNVGIIIPSGILFYGLGTALYAYYSSHPDQMVTLPSQPDQLVPWFVVSQLPSGIAGLIVAGIFAAAMSSLDSSMNSMTSAIVNDFVARGDNKRGGRDCLPLARKLTVLLGVIGTGGAMILATFEVKYLFDFFQKLVGFVGGGLSGVFILAVFSTRANSQGAFAGLVIGTATTVFVAFNTDVNFLLYAAVGTASCTVSGLVVSILTGGETRNMETLTFVTRNRIKNKDA